jgi:hypothetical protein
VLDLETALQSMLVYAQVVLQGRQHPFCLIDHVGGHVPAFQRIKKNALLGHSSLSAQQPLLRRSEQTRHLGVPLR